MQKKIFFRFSIVKMFNIHVFIFLKKWMHNIIDRMEYTRVQS